MEVNGLESGLNEVKRIAMSKQKTERSSHGRAMGLIERPRNRSDAVGHAVLVQTAKGMARGESCVRERR